MSSAAALVEDRFSALHPRLHPARGTQARPLRLAILLLALLALVGCATGGGMSEVDDGLARQLIAEGDYSGAAGEYQRLAKSNRRARASLLLLAADAFREEGRFDAVEGIATRIDRERLGPDENFRLDLLLAEAALARGRAQDALTLASGPDSPDPAAQARALEIRARALDALGRPVEAARARIALNALLPPAERAENDRLLLEGLARPEIAALQKAVVALERNDPLRPWLERALRLRGAVPARSMQVPTRQVGTLLPDAGDGAGMRREGYSSTPRVALLLPLSGTLAGAGGAVRDGIMAAYFADASARPQVQVFDTGDTVEGALAAYRNAVGSGSARAIGPLMREQVHAIFAQEQQPMPVLALNHPEDGSPPPAGSQSFGLLPDEEGAFAAERALERGHDRAGIVAGTEEWSERAALAFRAQFEARGGTVVGEARLAQGTVDFSGPLGQAMSGSPSALFLAVRPAQGRLVVPQVRARGGAGVALFATSHIYSGASARGQDRDLDGVEFCDAPWLFGAVPGMPARETLAAKLPAAAASARLFAFGMDAYRLLPYLDWLAENPDAYLPGASGQLALDGFGRVRRLPSWMRFVDGVPRAADGFLSPEAGAAP